MEAIQSEVKKYIDFGFIREEQHSDWVANIVPATKKNGKIWICIDFRDLNEACPKDEFPLSITDVMIDNTCGFKRMFAGLSECPLWMDSQGTIKSKCTLMMKSILLSGHHWGILLYCHALRTEKHEGNISESYECNFPRAHT